MIKRMKLLLCAAALLAAVLFSSCGIIVKKPLNEIPTQAATVPATTSAASETPTQAQQTPDRPADNPSDEKGEEKQKDSDEKQEDDKPDPPADEDVSFADIANTYVYTPGSGWGTFLTLYDDGSFTGTYSDSHNPPSNGEYERAMYYCSFYGTFTDLQKTGEYTYSFTLQSLDCEHESGSSEIKTNPDSGKRTLYEYTDPQGLSMDQSGFTYYAANTPLSEVPGDLANWIQKFRSGSSSDRLDLACLYQPGAPFGWHES